MTARWPLLLALLFLPNFWQFDLSGTYGGIKMMDVSLTSFVTVLIFVKKKAQVESRNLSLYLFVFWIILTVISMLVKYEYNTFNEVIYSSIKVIKYAFYLIGINIILSRISLENMKYFLMSLYLSAFLLSLSIMIDSEERIIHYYTGDNMRAVALCIVLVFLLMLYIFGVFRRVYSIPLLLFFIVALLASKGRGAMIGLAATILFYVFLNVRIGNVYIIAFSSALIIWTVYLSEGQFFEDVNRSLTSEAIGSSGIVVDDGRRGKILMREFPKILDNPIFGTGFFHRSYLSLLQPEGSHNQILQIFLETGIVGGIIYLTYFFRRLSRRYFSYDRAVNYTIIAAFICGMSGEYFYAGEAMLALFMIAFSSSLYNEYVRNRFHTNL